MNSEILGVEASSSAISPPPSPMRSPRSIMPISSTHGHSPCKGRMATSRATTGGSSHGPASRRSASGIEPGQTIPPLLQLPRPAVPGPGSARRSCLSTWRKPVSLGTTQVGLVTIEQAALPLRLLLHLDNLASPGSPSLVCQGGQSPPRGWELLHQHQAWAGAGHPAPAAAAASVQHQLVVSLLGLPKGPAHQRPPRWVPVGEQGAIEGEGLGQALGIPPSRAPG